MWQQFMNWLGHKSHMYRPNHNSTDILHNARNRQVLHIFLRYLAYAERRWRKSEDGIPTEGEIDLKSSQFRHQVPMHRSRDIECGFWEADHVKARGMLVPLADSSGHWYWLKMKKNSKRRFSLSIKYLNLMKFSILRTHWVRQKTS